MRIIFLLDNFFIKFCIFIDCCERGVNIYFLFCVKGIGFINIFDFLIILFKFFVKFIFGLLNVLFLFVV